MAIIRLPGEFADIIGTSKIYQTRCKKSTAFVAVLNDKEEDLLKEEVGQRR